MKDKPRQSEAARLNARLALLDQTLKSFRSELKRVGDAIESVQWDVQVTKGMLAKLLEDEG